jgi:two-component system, LytTR family, response regulator
MTMKIVLIEDEPLVARNLEQLILRVEPEAVVVAQLPSVERAVKWFREHAAPDLIVSDIRLADGISFEIFESLELSCPVIFTTAFDEYAIRAFKLNSIDYLLKPIDEDELRKAINKYKLFRTEMQLPDQLKQALEAFIHPEKKYKVRFLAMQRNALTPVMQEQVAYFHKDELIYLHTMTNERLISEHQTLDELEELLDPAVFFRVNRQYIIHIQSVAHVRSTHKGLLVELSLPGALSIEISREKATLFKNWLGH